MPVENNEVVDNGSSFVTYPDIETNTSGSLLVLPPINKDCFLSPGFGKQNDFQPIFTFPDSITVVSYLCIEDISNVR